MSRVPDDERPTTARWLISSRKAAGFRNAKAFLEAVKAAEGSAPSYSTYAQWESGEVTPRSESLEPIRRFHAAREPELPAPKPALDPWAIVERQTALLENQSRMLAHLEELTTHLVRMLDPQPPLPAAAAEAMAYLQQVLAESATPIPSPNPARP